MLAIPSSGFDFSCYEHGELKLELLNARDSVGAIRLSYTFGSQALLHSHRCGFSGRSYKYSWVEPKRRVQTPMSA